MNKAVLIFLVVVSTRCVAQVKNVSINIHPNNVIGKIDEKIYGQFLEHIYHSVNGGLWGEVVWNRSFEEALSTHGNWTNSSQSPTWQFTAEAIKVKGNNAPIIPIGSGEWKEYTLTLHARKTGGNGPVIVAIRHDRFSSLQLLLGNKLLLRSVQRAKTDTIATSNQTIEVGKWYKIKLSYSGNVCSASVDDKPLMSAEASAGREAGHFALGAIDGGEGEFKDMRVTAPNGKLLFEGMAAPARHWQLTGAGVQTALDTVNALNSRQSLKVTAANLNDGILQKHFLFKKGDVINGSIWVRGSVEGLLLRLRDGQKVVAEQSIAAPINEWKEYAVHLNPSANADDGSLEIVAKGKGVFWIDQVSLMPASYKANGGYRTDLLKAVTDLKPASIRWPGGSYVGGFKWKNTVGPQYKRIGKTGWDDFDPLAFGVDEFLKFCEQYKTEPVMVVNIGPRSSSTANKESLRDVCDLVEYCNGSINTTWGAVRAKNGHPKPYNIKYWELDNEVWSTKPEVYASLVNEFIAAMRKIDPNIIPIACGSGSMGGNAGQWPAGDEVIVNNTSSLVQFISPHHYEGAGGYASGPIKADAFLKSLGEKIAKSSNPAMKIYMSEWNLSSTDWRTGLYAGGILNVFEKNSDVVHMTCPALFLRHTSAPGWDNAFINFNQAAWFAAPNYIVMKLWRDHYALNKIAFTGEVDSLNIITTKSEDASHVYVKVVNPTTQAISLSMNADKDFKVMQASSESVRADSLTARNTMEAPHNISVVKSNLKVADGSVSITMHPFSVSIISLSKAQR